ncbi:hypothetical protein MGG_05695 [Pyricularia oryzae 70-15]|uniref:Phosphatidylcholine-sterol O-acyltransferase-like protein n=3 Tax=Pyricularia oryzae TaxID=318829 RepID=G4MP34_PYRO7|nr:uncharacterized protein MGG_05695 [Pyricularia oryzae 70-15]EHA57983.1 hypothetical protein MGG_05695 [Pyricularia oryzae 70-15]KAI7917949.1 hypothetical protein M9X92_007140 [Pyricularia oryzae]KAI7931323.1 hypothetical protein M0657_001277 [Pyricularia oryzae]
MLVMEPAMASGPVHTDPGQAFQQPPLHTLGSDQSGSRTDTSEEEDDGVFSEGEAAQSLFQPAISPIATRLAWPGTPAAEKAAAMWDFMDGPTDNIADSLSSNPSAGPNHGGVFVARPETPANMLNATLNGASSVAVPHKPASVPTIAPQNRPQMPESGAGKLSNSGTPGFSSRKRASTVGGDALKKLSRAIPSISMPSNFLPSLPTPSFFSSSSHKRDTSLSPTRNGTCTKSGQVTTDHSFEESSLAKEESIAIRYPHGPKPLRPLGRPGQAYTLRRSTSMESTLYNPMTRVSSYGDDERFLDVRKMTNSRFKAIMDSFDRPSFKMPQLPSMTSPFKSGSFTESSIGSVPRSPGKPRNSTISPKDGIAILDAVLESLTGDVVVLGGYRGSILRSASSPHQQLWVPVKVGLNMRKVNLEVGLDPQDEETMEEHIIPSSMLQNIGPIDISRRLLRRMRESRNAKSGTLRVHEFAYDWRLSPARSSARLLKFLEGLESNVRDKPSGALVVAHSLGGLITRHAVNQRPNLFSGVVYAGVPQRAINIIGPLRNGDAVLLNQKLLTAQVNFSFRTSFVFLPEDGECFVSKDGTHEFKFDFYDPENWVKYRLCPAVAPPLKPALPVSKLDSALYSLREMSTTISTFDLRGKSGSDDRGRKASILANGGVLGPPPLPTEDSGPHQTNGDDSRTSSPGSSQGQQEDQHYSRAYRYLARTLAETKQFRAETQHRPELSDSNAYPPLAVIYGKDTPTVHTVRVSSLDAIASPDETYNDLVFRSGDGVVLAREAMLPPGYDVVSGGRISTEKGHISILGDFVGVARAIEAVLRGRGKGIGKGVGAMDS